MLEPSVRVGAWLLLSLLLPGAQAAAPLEISGFAADLPGSGADDAVFLRNRSDQALDLVDYILEDGEGRIGFPEGVRLAPGREIAVAGRAEGFLEATGRLPDYALQGLDEGHSMRILDAGFALAIGGDDLRLVRGGIVGDRVVYGDASTEGDGWNGRPVNVSGRTELRWFPRLDRQDDDDRSDWQGLGRRILGADEFAPMQGNTTQVYGYTAPESSRAMVERIIGRADTHLRINVYQWRELSLLEPLREWRQRHPAARLDVLMAPNPVGESQEELSERAHVIHGLRGLGASVHFASRDRYSYDHAKYVIADGHSLLVQSENFVSSGIPLDPSEGNRGYGLAISGPELVSRFISVFEDDFRIEPHGATQAPTDAPRYAAPVLAAGRSQRGDVSFTTDIVPTILFTAPMVPDPATDPILQRIANATSRIRVAHLSLPPHWLDAEGSRVPNPYLEALVAAARRGVLVQLLLDGHFVDASDPGADNLDTVRLLEGQGLPIAVRLMRGASVLHAKTMLVDDEWTLAGSMNWNSNSVLHNREVSLLVKDPSAVRVHSAAFDEDWESAGAQEPWIPAPGASLGVALVGAVAFMLAHSKPSYRRRA